MSIFKCKMCGGTVEFEKNATVGTCDSCGTQQTLPRLSDDRRANLYDRANHFRRNNEFDKAMGIYEKILGEDNTDAEAYWSLVLCRYGIEYVEDPASHKRVPTVNRAQFTSVFDDDNYKSALQYADGYQRAIYQAEAAAINEIQKGILAISQKEEPFDVFICYKETDNGGRRTQDSVLANDLYHQLTQEGFKVFFARITLEDKLGSAYEPYIFAALNSAKVMVVLGTKPEYFNAVWVRNEWSRYLALVKQSGGKKVLIPAYKDMDPYDLPEEFSHLQAQDMGKLGFMQDLIRGIKKLAQTEAPKPAAVIKETVVTGGGNVAPLLERAFMFLEDGDWDSADAYCEKVLDIDPKNAEAYLGKLMAELRVRRREALQDVAQPFDGMNNYQKALRFGDAKLKDELAGAIQHINTRNETARLEGIYNQAKQAMDYSKTEAGFLAAAKQFDDISNHRDASAMAEKCRDLAEIARKDAIYAYAQNKMSGNVISGVEAAEKAFASISGWKDADELRQRCLEKIEKLKAEEEATRQEQARRAEQARKEAEKVARRKRLLVAVAAVVAVLLAVYFTVIQPVMEYNDAVALMEAGKTVEAYEAFVALDGYKDSKQKANGLYEEYKVEKLKIAKPGDILFFGSYEQDNNKSNGAENIQWRVLAKEGNRALLISEYALEARPYNTTKTDVTWPTCTLRTWLNGEFYNKAFSSAEQAVISTTTVKAHKNPDYSTNPGKDTQDKVFLLSIQEVNQYFGSDEARRCVPTAYAIAQGAYTNNDYKVGGKATCWWWLRSPGDYQYRAAFVFDDGGVGEFGDYVDADDDCVRPALWINLAS